MIGNYEALTPAEMTDKAESIGIKKANSKAGTTLLLSFLGGAYIALGAVFSITTISGSSGILPFGIIKVMAGLAFSLGLILIMVGGGELFTGNVLLIIALIRKQITLKQYLKNLFLVFTGNFVGAFSIVLLTFFAGRYMFGSNVIGTTAMNIGIHKLEYPFFQAFSLGILCNILVCLGVWLAYSCRGTGDKVLAIVFPITAFVAGGFEHCVANMFYLPFAMIVKNFSNIVFPGIFSFTGDMTNLTISNFVVHNLIPVTLGNFVGGAIFIGLVYAYIYKK